MVIEAAPSQPQTAQHFSTGHHNKSLLRATRQVQGRRREQPVEKKIPSLSRSIIIVLCFFRIHLSSLHPHLTSSRVSGRDGCSCPRLAPARLILPSPTVRRSWLRKEEMSWMHVTFKCNKYNLVRKISMKKNNFLMNNNRETFGRNLIAFYCTNLIKVDIFTYSPLFIILSNNALLTIY